MNTMNKHDAVDYFGGCSDERILEQTRNMSTCREQSYLNIKNTDANSQRIKKKLPQQTSSFSES